MWPGLSLLRDNVSSQPHHYHYPELATAATFDTKPGVRELCTWMNKTALRRKQNGNKTVFPLCWGGTVPQTSLYNFDDSPESQPIVKWQHPGKTNSEKEGLNTGVKTSIQSFNLL